MARKHSLPVLPLLANVWHNGNPVTNPPDAVLPCELVTRVTVRGAVGTATSAQQALSRFIYFGLRADVRPVWGTTHADVLEVPAGSGRLYEVVDVDDVARGLPNEFRVAAVIVQTGGTYPTWPIPIP